VPEPEPSLDDLLVEVTPPVREIALHGRDVLRGLLPGTIEQIDLPARLIAFGRDRTLKGQVCGLTLHKAHANLMFARGTALEDPAGLLEGTGKLARHVKLREPDAIDRPEVRELVLQAARLTP
jgi:hypothetical protein